MRMQRARQIIVALLVGGLVLGGLANRASAQAAALDTSQRITLAPYVERSISNEALDPPSALDPYHSLKAHVTPAPQSGALTLPSPGAQRIHLNRGQKMFWGTVGLVVHTICDAQTHEVDPAVDHSSSYQTYGESRCDHCDRIGARALHALTEGLFSPDS
jgi:hypothetical protein